jgi:hypothetical protein
MCFIPSLLIEVELPLLGLLCITFSSDCAFSSKVHINFSNIKIRIEHAYTFAENSKI